MKKFFTLFAIALLSICASAEEIGPCPSTMSFALTNANNLSAVRVELQLVNSSLNLNGFNMEIPKVDGIDFKSFTANGYGKVILARWEGTTQIENEDGDMEDVEITDAIRNSLLTTKCDVKWNVKDNGNLVIIEILSSNDCRFFPVLETPTGIGRFNVDMSGAADGKYTIVAPQTAQGLSFSYTQGPEPLDSWTTDAPVEITLEKKGTEVTEYTGISTITADQAVDNRIFDLQGRELQSVPEHGIYIQNGKKYVK